MTDRDRLPPEVEASLADLSDEERITAWWDLLIYGSVLIERQEDGTHHLLDPLAAGLVRTR